MSELSNQRLELAIIGNLMFDDEADISELKPDYFEFLEPRTLFSEMLELKQKGEVLDHIDLVSTIRMRHEMSIDMNNALIKCEQYHFQMLSYKTNCRELIRIHTAREVYKLGKALEGIKPNSIKAYLKRAKERIEEIGCLYSDGDMRTISPENIMLDEISKSGYVPTGFETIDYALNDLEPKRVTIVTGKSFDGKTTFVRTVIANAIESKNKVLWVMGENEVKDEMRRLYQIVIGKNKRLYNNKIDNKRVIKIPKPEVIKALHKWFNGNLSIIHKAEAKLKNQNQLIAMLERELSVNKHKLIVIDNLMSVLSASSAEKNEAQADFMQTLCDLAKVYSTHIILVVHPRKGANTKDCVNDDISGNSDIPNKADNIIWVIRSDEEDKEKGIDGHIKVTKNKRWGKTTTINTVFDDDTESLAEFKDDKALIQKYSINIELPIDINPKLIVDLEQEELF